LRWRKANPSPPRPAPKPKPAPSPVEERRTMPNEPTIMPPKLKLPRDAHIAYQEYPPELYISMTITKVAQIHALYDTLELYSRLLENDE
jgi:hypothetical protein